MPTSGRWACSTIALQPSGSITVMSSLSIRTKGVVTWGIAALTSAE